MTEEHKAWIPEIVGDWWQIAGNPDLGKYQTDRQEPLDFGIWQAADGTWQLWSCVRYTGCGGKTRLFYRWEGEIQEDVEVLLFIKTLADQFESMLIPKIQELHPYEVPEIIAFPIDAGESKYLEWITKSVNLS